MSYPPPPPPPNEPDDSGSTPPPPPPPYGAPPVYGTPPAYGTPPPGGGYGYPAGYAVPESNKKAMWSLILGIVSLFCCGIVTGVVAIVLSQQAKREIEASGGMQSGAGQAQAGFILGIVGIALTVLGLVVIGSGGGFSS